MVKVVWTKTALSQFERITKYLIQESGNSAAKTVSKRIIESAESLETFPSRGTIEQLLAHKKSEYRFIIVWSYKIIYRVTKNRVVISRVFHTARNPEKLKGS